DLSIYREGVQSFFFYKGSLNNPNNNVTFLPWGTTGDKAQRGDFDGDGKQDAAVFRPTESLWYIRQSLDNQSRIENWGLSSDRFVPSDYDGDGRTDLAVFRDSDRVWYIRQSRTNQARYVQFGLATDTLVPADYDGDGSADVAIYRSGDWWIINSRTGLVSTVRFGLAGDKPIPTLSTIPAPSGSPTPTPTPTRTPTPTPTPTSTPTPTQTPTPTPTPTPDGTVTTFSGRATSVNATINGENAIINDTGELPPTGGFITRSLASANVFEGALITGALDATTQAAFDQSRANTAVYDLNLTLNGNVYTSVIAAQSSQSTCVAANSPPVTDGAFFGNLLMNGVPITITGAISQRVDLPNGAYVIINEQIRSGSGNSAQLKANGLHFVVPGQADIIFSSAQSGISCPTQ
ncbi:MAG: VCBS repeat-containing protein, partial [Acidobacteriota bacterium]|nr:VCBS repeat-containing protein [Acidobacteriota bacterium]